MSAAPRWRQISSHNSSPLWITGAVSPQHCVPLLILCSLVCGSERGQEMRAEKLQGMQGSERASQVYCCVWLYMCVLAAADCSASTVGIRAKTKMHKFAYVELGLTLNQGFWFTWAAITLKIYWYPSENIGSWCWYEWNLTLIMIILTIILYFI